MSKLFTRRRMLTATGGVALSPLALGAQRAAAAAPPPSGPLVTLLTPLRLYDSRSDVSLLGGAKLAAGGSVIVTVAVPAPIDTTCMPSAREALSRANIAPALSAEAAVDEGASPILSGP